MTHRIELAMDSDGIRAEFVCEADSDGECHQSCAFGCEIWDAACMENHPRELIGYCNPIEFMTNGGDFYELYAGGETEPRSGPIIFEWQSDWYGWRYDDDAEQLNTAAETQP